MGYSGRPLRVMVNAEDVDDPGANSLAKAVSERIQETHEHPGQIAVLVIRGTRAAEHTHEDGTAIPIRPAGG